MTQERMCGVLCHPTSLPGPYGIGELGVAARNLVDFLARAGQAIWQVLPLGPTGYGDSPYQSFSAFAGNHLLIALEELQSVGLLTAEDLVPPHPFPDDAVTYGEVIAFKDRVLRQSYASLLASGGEPVGDMASFCERNSDWLDDYCLFMALKLHFGYAAWTEWDRDIALREPGAVERWRDKLAYEVGYQRYLQFLFDRQWRELKLYANRAGIRIMGDMPVFVGHDSADVWAHRELFFLDELGHPTVVAGVPPDYFSSTGQRWGNPLYRWDHLREKGYVWWIRRLQHALAQVDELRLDHFRGLAGYWEVPASEETAIHGRWVKGPGADLLQAVERSLGKLPIVAEDLGLISVDVDVLREQFELPGMRVLQFAFDSDATNVHLPHNYPRNVVVYTGTHDNDTTQGWFATLDERIKHRVRVYTASSGTDIHWALLAIAYNSVARVAIASLQDLLGLGSEARLNQPGRPYGNWAWRFRSEMVRDELADALGALTGVSGRLQEPNSEASAGKPLVLAYEDP